MRYFSTFYRFPIHSKAIKAKEGQFKLFGNRWQPGQSLWKANCRCGVVSAFQKDMPARKLRMMKDTLLDIDAELSQAKAWLSFRDIEKARANIDRAREQLIALL